MDSRQRLVDAVNAGDAARVRELLAAGDAALASAYSDDGWSLLHLATTPEIAADLLEHGAEINAKNRHPVYGPENTPLSAQVYAGREEVVALLIERGANVNRGDRAGWTPLHLAAANGRVELVRLLLEHGADAHARTRSDTPAAPPGATPLDLTLDDTRTLDDGTPVGADRLRAVADLLRART